jgi:hypothetical protein
MRRRKKMTATLRKELDDLGLEKVHIVDPELDKAVGIGTSKNVILYYWTRDSPDGDPPLSIDECLILTAWLMRNHKDFITTHVAGFIEIDLPFLPFSRDLI